MVKLVLVTSQCIGTIALIAMLAAWNGTVFHEYLNPKILMDGPVVLLVAVPSFIWAWRHWPK